MPHTLPQGKRLTQHPQVKDASDTADMEVFARRQERLRLILREITAAELARRSGVSASSITRYLWESERKGAKNIGEMVARKLERGAGKPPGWLDNRNAPVTSAGSPPLAHSLNPPIQSDALPTITWEALVGNVPESLFVLALRDDALAPDYPKGTAVVWSKTRAPRPGRLVLVRDAHGRDHARLIQEGKAPGEWTAAALHRGFASLDPEGDGLTVLAVHKGVLDADDE